MPLRFVGNQCVRTAATTRTNDATTLSLSTWIRLNPVAQLAIGDTFLFCHGAWNALHILLPDGSRGYFMCESRVHSGAQVDTASNLVWTPEPGVAYHVAFVMAGGVHRWYVNAELLHEATRAGMLGYPGNPSRPLSIGLENSSGGTLDITVDDPTIWEGYALTPADVMALRERAKRPEEIAPAQVGWRLTLDGTAGAVAKVGDPGLVDQGAAKLPAATVVGSPKYESGALSYVVPPPKARVRRAGLMPSRKGIFLEVETTGGQPADIRTIATHPTISVDGGSPVTLSNPIWATGQYRFPFLYYPLPATLPAGSKVTLSAADRWATSAVGDVAGMANLAAPVGSALPPFDPGAKTMRIGYNVPQPLHYSCGLEHANLAKRASIFYNVPIDGRGYPTSMVGQPSIECDVVLPPPNGYDDKGLPAAPAGTYVLKYAGAADLQLVAGDGATTVTRASDVVQGPDRARTYSVAIDPARTNCPWLRLRANGINFDNVRVYPPGVDATDPPLFHPDFLRQVGDAACLRFLDPLEVNGSNWVDYADWPKADRYTYNNEYLTKMAVDVVRVAPYANEIDPYWEANSPRLRILCTTPKPHGLSSGMRARFAGTAGPLATTTGGSLTLDDLYVTIAVHSPTTFSADPLGQRPGEALAAARDLAPGSAQLVVPKQDGWPLEDVAAIGNATRADVWICMPLLATDACVSEVVTRLAQGLAPGKKMYLEYSNECWNYGFNQTWAEDGKARVAGVGSGRVQYAMDAAHVHELARSAWTAAGRPAADLVRVMATQAAWAGNTTEAIASYCQGAGKDFEVLASSAYFENSGKPFLGDSGEHYDWGTMAARFDALSDDQTLDLLELHLLHGHQERFFTDHRPILDAHGLKNVQIVTYEGGPEVGLTIWTPPTSAAQATELGRRSRLWVKHPRFRDCFRYALQRWQDGGCVLYNHYTLQHGGMSMDVGNGYRILTTDYGAYRGSTMKAGRGDGSDGLFDNRTDYEASGKLVSVMGYTLDEWMALAGQGDVVAKIKSVSVSPATASVAGGKTLAFTATVAVAGNLPKDVTWSCSAGSIDAAGLFTAPAFAAGMAAVTITAKSAADPAKMGTATVTITDPGPGATVTGVTVSPATASVVGGQAKAFAASVVGAGAPSQAVTWSCSAGSITQAGTFTAPPAADKPVAVTIAARSAADPTKAGTATATVAAAPVVPAVTGVTVAPATTTVTGGPTQPVTFTATVVGTGSPAPGVTWSCSAGTITPAGVFSAPPAAAAQRDVTITATSVADPTKAGTATATIPAAVVDPPDDTIRATGRIKVAGAEHDWELTMRIS